MCMYAVTCLRYTLDMGDNDIGEEESWFKNRLDPSSCFSMTSVINM